MYTHNPFNYHSQLLKKPISVYTDHRIYAKDGMHVVRNFNYMGIHSAIYLSHSLLSIYNNPWYSVSWMWDKGTDTK